MKWPYDPYHDLKFAVGWGVGWGGFLILVLVVVSIYD